MNIDTVIYIMTESLILAIRLAGPFLIASLVVGVLVSIFQAATQIQEFTLQFIPKIIVAALVLFLAGPWMISSIVEYTDNLYRSIPELVKDK